MDEKIYDNYLYLDTNIYGHLCRNNHLIRPLSEFLFSNNLSIALTGANMAELHDAGFLHDDLIRLIISLPSSLLISWDVILKHETQSHPNIFKDSILGYPLNSIIFEENGIAKLQEIFNSQSLSEARKLQVENSTKLREKHLDLKNNFPPSKNGKYTQGQAKDFSDQIVFQFLYNSHPSFLKHLKNKGQILNTNIFLTIKIYAFTIYYKYYLGNRNPDKKSDFGDLFHLPYIPYCKMAIMEKDICDILNKIKRNESILKNIEIYDIKFFNSFN